MPGEPDKPTTGAERARFSVSEVEAVCARYPVGRVLGINDFPHGAPGSPKAVVRTERGRYLLKRREAGRDDPYKVAISHEIQLFLAERGFPTPEIIGTSDENNSLLQAEGWVYELFEFIEGNPYVADADAARDAGRVLARLHHEMADFAPTWTPAVRPAGGGVDAPALLEKIGSSGADAGPALSALKADWERAVLSLEKLGVEQRRAGFVHGDWHPGNTIYRGDRVAAVLDYESARLAPSITELAPAALLFAMRREQGSPDGWSERPDLPRLQAFWTGYRAGSGAGDGREAEPGAALDRAAAPWLMVQSLIGQAAPPIASAGRFGRHDGPAMLRFTARMTAWLRDHASALSDWLAQDV